MLRDYQSAAIDSIRAQFSLGKRKVLLHLATGAGKTVVFCDMIRAADAKGKKTLVVVRGRKLVDQASVRLFRERVQHGVLMAKHWNYRPHLPNQVASIDTLISRRLRPDADLIIIDEAHMAASKGYKEFLAKYDTFIVAVTATPYGDKSLKHVADTVVQPITMEKLIEQNYLVPFRYFAPSQPDLRGVAVSASTKDYVNDQLEVAMSGLTGHVIEHWIKISEGRPTICFAVNIHHSKMLAERFKGAGVPAEHCDADTKDDERNHIIRRLESGETKVVCNVGIFCTGVDIPCLGAIIMARPTKSRNLFIQQAGRGTRIFPGKANCILLDHSGNILRHGFPTDELEVDLDGKGESEKHVRESKICKNCFAVFRGTKCPACGVEPPVTTPKEIQETNETLKEVDPVMQEWIRLKRQGKEKGYKAGWAQHRLVNKFGFELAKPHLTQWFIDQKIRAAQTRFANSPFTPCQVESHILKAKDGKES